MTNRSRLFGLSLLAVACGSESSSQEAQLRVSSNRTPTSQRPLLNGEQT